MITHLEVLTLAIAVLVLTALCRGVCGRVDFDKEATLPLRALLALLVVLHHTWVSSWLSFGTYAVSVFFFLSGYGMSKSFNSKGKKYLQGLLSRYAVKLFLPYALCVVLNLLIKAFFFGDRSEDFSVIWREGNFYPVLPFSWYPWALLVFAMIFVCAYRFSTKGKRLLGVGVGLAVYYIVVQYCLHWHPSWYLNTWAFLVGCAYAETEDDWIRSLSTNGRKLMLSLAVVFSLCMSGAIFSSDVPILTECGYAFLGLVVVCALRCHPLPKWRWLYWLGMISYEIYLVHGVVLLFAPRFSSIRIMLPCMAGATIGVAFVLYCIDGLLMKYLVRR